MLKSELKVVKDSFDYGSPRDCGYGAMQYMSFEYLGKVYDCELEATGNFVIKVAGDVLYRGSHRISHPDSMSVDCKDAFISYVNLHVDNPVEAEQKSYTKTLADIKHYREEFDKKIDKNIHNLEGLEKDIINLLHFKPDKSVTISSNGVGIEVSYDNAVGKPLAEKYKKQKELIKTISDDLQKGCYY